ncbi:MAG: DUF5717 family protein [Clostridiales bacterium]|jgi:hypothetical protein|nr:DUF5717 family protein [Clostridiales bacterium]
MDALFYKINRLKNANDRKKSLKTALLLMWRHIQAYIITGDGGQLRQARAVTAACLSEDKSSVSARLAFAFVSFLAEDYQGGEEALRELEVYKSWFYRKEPGVFRVYLFLRALRYIRLKKTGGAQKCLKQLEELAPRSVLTAYLEIEREDWSAAYARLTEVKKDGGSGFLLNLCLYQVFIGKFSSRDGAGLFPDFLSWCVKEGFFPERRLDFYKSSIARKKDDLSFLKMAYQYSGRAWILKMICEGLILRLDYTAAAREYYREAENKQLDVPELPLHLMKASFINKNEDISRYAMSRFLKYPDSGDEHLKAFVYHLLTSEDKFADLKNRFISEILGFAYDCARIGLKGRYYNSLYAFFFERASGEYAAVKEKCAEICAAEALWFEGASQNPETEYVWVFDAEKEGHEVFRATHNPPYPSKARVKSVSASVNYVCFDKTGKRVTDDEIDFKRLAGNYGAISRHIRDKNPKDADLRILCARVLLEGGLADEGDAEFLSAVSSLKGLSKAFRARLRAALGDFYAGRGDFSRAVAFYAASEENCLDDEQAERILSAFVEAGELERAAALIEKRGEVFPDGALFDALKKIAAKKELHAAIAQSCYNITLRGLVDEAVASIAVNSYNGSLREYQELSEALLSAEASAPALDIKILRKALEIRDAAPGAQKIFARAYNADYEKNKVLLDDFIYYLCYEVIVNGLRLSYEAANALERRFAQTGEALLSCALLHLYAGFSLRAPGWEGVCLAAADFMEAEGIMFPAVLELKDKLNFKPYILKNRPFMYQALPGKNVFMYYTARGSGDSAESGTETARRVKMRYFRFGLYLCAAPHFYGETLSYHFSEETDGGSISTQTREVSNSDQKEYDFPDDEFFLINNALICERIMRHGEAERIIGGLLDKGREVSAKLI